MTLSKIMRTKYGLAVFPESVGGKWTREDYQVSRKDRHKLELSKDFACVLRSHPGSIFIDCMEYGDD
jgi:RNA:NAD 2'-phosphotransferase (TPT1/KptA family)